MANRTVKVTIEASVAGAIANLRTFTGAVKEMGSELDRAATKHPERLNKIANATGVLGIGAAVAFGAITKVAMDFDRQMSAVVAVSDDGAKSLGALRTAALAAGRDTAFTATQAAQAEEELAKAGVSTKDILGGALAGTMNLAAAGTLELADAATVAAEAMTEFGLAGKDVGHIADVLTAGANKSTADVAGLGMALGQVGGVAHQTGLSLEDTVGTLSAFTQAGMNGEEAGTTLKQMLLQLQSPSQQSADLMKQLGINIYDAQGHFIGITGVANNLQSALGNLDEAQRNAALGTIFGSRAVRGATVLYQEGASGIQGWIDGVNQSGIAAQTAAQKQDNLAGDLHKLLGSLQAVAIQASGGTNAGLRDLAQGAEKALNAFLGLPKPVQEAATVLLAVSAAGLLATSGLLKVKVTVTQAMEALRGIGPVGEKAAGVLASIGKWGGIAGVAAAASFGLYEGMRSLTDWLDKKSGPTIRDVDGLTTSLKDFAQTGKIAGELAKTFGDSLGKVSFDLGHLTIPAGVHQGSRSDMGSTKGAVSADQMHQLRQDSKQAKEDIDKLDQSLAGMVAAGNAAVARSALVELAKQAGISVDELLSKLPKYQAATDSAAASSGGLSQGLGTVASNADLMSRGLQSAVDHGLSLLDVLKQLNGANLDAAHAEDQFWQAVDDADQKIKDNGKTLDVHTQKGRENREALLGIAEAANQAAQATYNQTNNLDDANAVLAEARKRLIAAAIAAGDTKQQAEALADQLLRIPPVAETKIRTPGADLAAAQAQKVENTLNRLDGRVVDSYVNVITRDQASATRVRGDRWGGVYEHAATGMLRDASLYAPVNPGRYMIAEPSTQGEAFIPKRGDLGRSRGLADYVVSHWLGGSTSWGGRSGGGGGGHATVTNHYTISVASMDPRAAGPVVIEAIKSYERSNGTNWRNVP